MSANLKPCPFCGSPAIAENGFLPAESITYAFCSDLSCPLHSVDVGFTVEEWQRRVEEKVASPSDPE